MLWLRTLLFALTFVATTLVYVPRWLIGSSRHLTAGAPLVAGAVLVVAGAALMVWCWIDFGARGRGTPAPFDPPRRLVIAGPYRYVRNPMYIAALSVLLGQALLYASTTLVWYTVIFFLAANAFVIGYEERTLARRFGREYATYRASVRRWIPKRVASG